MTTYSSSAVSNTVIAYEKPITLQQGRALRDNPIAISEGSTNAPVAQAGWHPYNMAAVGDGATGIFYDFAVHGAQSTITTPDFVDGYEYAVLLRDISQNTGSETLSVQLYRETDAAYGTAIAVTAATAISASDTIDARIELPFVRMSVKGQAVTFFTGETQSAGAAVATVGTSMCVRTAQKRTRAQFSWISGATNFDAGTARLVRRRTLVV